MILALLSACGNAPDELVLKAKVYEEESDTEVLPGATVAAYDADGALFSEQTADDEGLARIAIPYAEPVYLSVSSEDHLPTAYGVGSFLGDVDYSDQPGVLWPRSESGLEAIRDTFASCDNVDAEGVVVEGEVRLYIDGQDFDDLPLVTTAWVDVYDAAGNHYDACYLDDKGKSSGSTEVTGETGRFAVFGVPAGAVTVNVAYTFAEGVEPDLSYFVWVPDGGTAPFYPALAFLP